MLVARRLVVGYERPLIRPLDLEVRPGEPVAFYGPNGVGKTTLAKVLATLLSPLGGSIELYGNPIKKMRRHIFYLPETVEVPPKVKALEYVEAVASFYGISDLAEEVLRAVGVPPQLELEKMSQGMKRRVQLASALAVAPKVKLAVLDDPYVSIDPEGAAELHEAVISAFGNAVLALTSRSPLKGVRNIDFFTLKP
ncbi:MAG: ATP-binding cassette domain-containing protein [Thermoproteus sp.]